MLNKVNVVHDVVDVEDIVVVDDEDAVVEDRPDVADVGSVVMEVVSVVDNEGGGAGDVVEMLELVFNMLVVVGRTVTDEIVELFLGVVSLLKFLVSIDGLVLFE
jgi:hypothetical protein